MKSLIIIPIYNERDNLETLIPDIFKSLPQTDILLIDDHSPDGSARYIKERQQTDPRLHLVERPQKWGLGSAYVLGFQWGLQRNYAFFFGMDGDGSHDPRFFPQLLAAAKQCDMVLGCRYTAGGKIENWNIFRRILSRWGNFYAKHILRVPYNDLTGSYRCFRRKTLEAFNFSELKSDGYCFSIEIAYLAHQKKFKIKEVPITFTERTRGRSKISRKIILEAAIRVPLLRLSSLR